MVAAYVGGFDAPVAVMSRVQTLTTALFLVVAVLGAFLALWALPSLWWTLPALVSAAFAVWVGVVWRWVRGAVRRDAVVLNTLCLAVESGQEVLALDGLVSLYDHDEGLRFSWLLHREGQRAELAERDEQWYERYLRGEASDF